MIVTWCTIDHGVLKTVAKGARRPKSQFSGKLDLFFEGEFEIIRSKKSDLQSKLDVFPQTKFPAAAAVAKVNDGNVKRILSPATWVILCISPTLTVTPPLSLILIVCPTQ